MAQASSNGITKEFDRLVGLEKSMWAAFGAMNPQIAAVQRRLDGVIEKIGRLPIKNVADAKIKAKALAYFQGSEPADDGISSRLISSLVTSLLAA